MSSVVERREKVKNFIFKAFIFIGLLIFVVFAWKHSAPQKESPAEEPLISMKMAAFGKAQAVKPGINVFKEKSAYVLALFDGDEGTTSTNNEIINFLENIVEDMGFKVAYHDISRGLPTDEKMNNYRVVLSWYRDSKMRKAAAYCVWIARQIADRRKVIILGNFGAYQDSTTDQWLPLSKINEAFNSLGLSYEANWTSNPQLLKIEHKDTSIVEFEHPLSVKESRHYFLFRSLLDKNRVHLSVKRTDIPASSSAIVVSTPYGGMALSNYIYRRDARTGELKWYVNFKKFILESLWPQYSQAREEKILIIWDATDEESIKYIKNLAYTFNYAKLPFETIDVYMIGAIVGPDLKAYTKIILAFDGIWKLGGNPMIEASLKSYVRDGGVLVVLCHAYNETLGELFGIEKYYGTHPEVLPGIRFVQPLYPGMEGLNLTGEEFETSVFDFDLASNIEIVAVSQKKNQKYPDGFPLAWRVKYGQGETFYWNVDILYKTSFRGFVLQSILATGPVSVASLANIEVVFIDDCPMPMWNRAAEPIASEYGMTDTEFYLRKWWPDMVKISQDFDINYTAFVVFNYNAQVIPPYDNSQFYIGENRASFRLGQAVLKEGYEIGLHGYNHQSLLLAPFDPVSRGWEKEENMMLALQMGKTEWDKNFPHPPFVYVAPNNAIDSAGKRAISQVFPSIKVISTIWTPDEYETGTEFGHDPEITDIYNIPRMSDGYFLSRIELSNMISGLAIFGVWTHFIHPDDVYDPERSGGKNWQEMFDSMNSLFRFVRSTYPWLRNMTAGDAYYELLRYEQTSVRYIIGEGKVEIDYNGTSANPRFSILRLNNGQVVDRIEPEEEGKWFPWQDGIYIISTTSSRITVYFSTPQKVETEAGI